MSNNKQPRDGVSFLRFIVCTYIRLVYEHGLGAQRQINCVEFYRHPAIVIYDQRNYKIWLTFLLSCDFLLYNTQRAISCEAWYYLAIDNLCKRCGCIKWLILECEIEMVVFVMDLKYGTNIEWIMIFCLN